MTDLDERLRRGIAAVAETERPRSTTDEVLASLERGLGTSDARHRSRRILGLVAVVAALGLVGALVVARRPGRGGAGRVVVGPVVTASPGPFPAGLHEWGRGPLAGAFNPTPVWDGHRVVVLGGDLTSSDPSSADRVAAMDPATGAWRTLPSLPFVPGPPEAQFVSGTACGDLVLAWDLDGQFAELAPGARTWTSLPPAPDSASDALGAPAYCTGDGVIFPWSAKGYTFATRTWRTLEPGAGTTIESTAWTGREVVLIEAPTGVGTGARTFVYDPASGALRAVATSPLEAFGPTLAWTGSRIIETNAVGQAATFDLATDRWARLPDLPASVIMPDAIASDLQVVAGTAYVLSGRTVARLGDDDRWTVVGSSVLPAPFELGWSTTVGDTLITWAAGTAGRGLQTYGLPG